MGYRKPDQYYIDLYDRETIEDLKAKEKKEQEELIGVEDPKERWKIDLEHSVAYDSFRNSGIFRARGRKNFIEQMIRRDENMDRLIEKTAVPKGICCKTCGTYMTVSEHFFDVADIPMLFVFECPEGHVPRRVIYPDGREYFFPKDKCKKCGFETTRKTKKLKRKIIITYNCAMCGDIWTDKLDLRIKEKGEVLISPGDRAKYCLGFEGKKTFTEDLKALTNLLIELDKGAVIKQKLEASGADKIEKLTIPEVEARLLKVTEAAGFIKFQFEKPEMRQFVKVSFSAQDPSKRDEKESLKALTGAIKKELKQANWRLVGEITYRLGYLNGALKAFEQDEDLIKLREESKKKIQAKKVKKK